MIKNNNKEEIIKLFKQNHVDIKDDKKIVLYGIGKMTQYILEEINSNMIYGVLDGYTQHGKICGIDIIPIQTLKDKKVKIIVLSTKASERIIYNRIRKFCSKNSIPIYNLKGEKLTEIYNRKNVCIDKNYTYEKLYEKIQKYEIISFDIFDTLLMRKILYTEKIFEIIQNKLDIKFDFKKERMQAEKILSVNSVPTINDIYKYIKEKNKVSESEIKKMLAMELEIESNILFARKDIKKIFDESVAMGKTVYLISDMYFSKEFIERILKQNKIFGYKEILISSEYKVDKERGLFYEYLKRIKSGDLLHIGDSQEKDIECAKRYNIDTFKVKSCMELSQEAIEYGILVNYNGEYPDNIRSIIQSVMFNNAFSGIDKIQLSPYDYGYCIIGPILTAIAKWMIEVCNNENIDSVLFISRDGYLLKQIYDLILEKENHSNIGQSKYLIISRTVAVLAQIENENDIEKAIQMPFSGTAEEMAYKRFHLEVKVDKIEDILLYKDIIIKKAGILRNRYLKYLKNQKINFCKKNVIFDFVSTGTCQMCLEKIVRNKLNGLYFEKVEDETKKNLNIIGYINELNDIKCENYLEMEIAIKEPEPSIKDIDEQGKMVLNEERFNTKQKKLICELQEGAKKFCKEYLYLIEQGLKMGNFNEDVKMILKLLNQNNVVTTNNIFRGVDEFTNRNINY